MIELSAMGWKEAALLALVILTGYLGYALMRLSMLNARRDAEPAPPPAPPPAPAPAPVLPPLDLQAELDSLLDARLAPLMQALETRVEVIEDRLDGVSRRIETVNQLPPVAPQYSEALSLAARGLSAEAIAEQCDMSIGEADLVRTLAQSRGLGEQS